MAKIPDFTKIVEKLDLQNIVDNVKSVINPGSVIPDEGGGDPVLTAFVELHKSIKNVAEIQAQQAKEIARLNNMIAALFNKLKEDKVIDFGDGPHPVKDKPAAEDNAKANAEKTADSTTAASAPQTAAEPEQAKAEDHDAALDSDKPADKS